ncbi:MAG TPA: tripartite tricarboxylate transporter substrate binding protein, partial [Burkholderiales bacterium]|nr:tripartite tricarboxylate transporter substrate binding protein [Burkholderiales bacterium]
MFLLLSNGAAAQGWPNKPVRLLIPSTPGGSVDTIGRTIAPRISERWGQQLVVENRPGAGGTIAGDLVAKSAPDGYTLLLGTIAALATNISLQKKLPYDPLKDFAPVTLVATQNLMLVVHPSVPARTVKELVRFAKAQPGKLSFASAGNGSGSHLSGELFKQTTGIDILHVPYKGVQPAMVDVISGQVAMNFPSILSALPHVRSGRVRALAVTGAKRTRAAPDLPTMQEAGIKDYESMTWYAVVAPAGTPQDVVTKLSSEIAGIVKQPEVADRLSSEGADPVGSTPQ